MLLLNIVIVFVSHFVTTSPAKKENAVEVKYSEFSAERVLKQYYRKPYNLKISKSYS